MCLKLELGKAVQETLYPFASLSPQGGIELISFCVETASAWLRQHQYCTDQQLLLSERILQELADVGHPV